MDSLYHDDHKPFDSPPPHFLNKKLTNLIVKIPSLQ